MKLYRLILFTGTLAWFLPTAFSGEPNNKELNILEEGNFEQTQGGMPQGFHWTGFAGAPSVTPNRFEVVTESGNSFVRLTVPPATGKQIAWVELREAIPLRADWGLLKVSAKLRVKDYVQGEQGWNGVKVFLNFFDADGKPLGDEVSTVSVKEDFSGWTLKSRELVIPPGAQSFKIKAGIIGSAGAVDIDDLSVVPVKVDHARQ